VKLWGSSTVRFAGAVLLARAALVAVVACLGAYPTGGHLYGTTSGGGQELNGEVFAITR
jgi:hypothetical protein